MATMAGNKTFQIIRETDSTPSKQVEFYNYDVFISDSIELTATIKEFWC